MVVIVSGERGIGKTTLLGKVVALAGRKRWDVAGVLALPRMYAGQKVGIDAEDLRSGQCRPFADRRRGNADPVETAGALATCAWRFDLAVMAWGNAVLEQSTPCDLLVVDELGPLELVEGKGWQAGLSALASGDFRHALVVVRPSLLDQFRQRYRGPVGRVLMVDEENRNTLLPELAALLGLL